jgi:splicing factor 3B subunit 3
LTCGLADYVPQKAAIDGDLCETYAKLSQQKQATIAEELGRTVGEVMKKLESIRIASSGW